MSALVETGDPYCPNMAYLGPLRYSAALPPYWSVPHNPETFFFMAGAFNSAYIRRASSRAGWAGVQVHGGFTRFQSKACAHL